MSNITQLKEKIYIYSHLTDPISLLHNNAWFQFLHYHLQDCFQYQDSPHFQCGRSFTRIQNCVIIDLFRNAHFWTLTWTINIFQPFIRLTIIFISQYNFHTFVLPFTIIILPWYIILILFYRLLIFGQPIPIQSQLPHLTNVWTILNWRIKSYTINQT